MLNTIFALMVLGALCVYLLIHYGVLSKITEEKIAPLLCEQLDTRIDIGEVEVDWLNQLALNDVVIYDQQDDTLLFVSRAMVSYDILPLLQQQFNINTVQLIGFELQIRQDSLGADPNYKFIIDKLAPQQEEKRQSTFDLKLNALHLRRGQITYRLGNDTEQLPFPNYKNLHFTDIAAAMRVEISRANGMDILVKRFTIKESAGLDFEGTGRIHDDSLTFCCKHLSLESPLPARIMMNGECAMNLNHPDSITYNLCLDEVSTDVAALRKLGRIYSFQLPDIDGLLSDAQEKFHLQGKCHGIGKETITLEGLLSCNGTTMANANVLATYRAQEENPYWAKASAQITQIPFNNHLYKDIEILAETNGKHIEGEFVSDDPLIKAKGAAEVDIFNKSCIASFNTDVDNIDLHKLNLVKWENLEGINMRGHAQGKFTLRKGEWPIGNAQLSDLTLESAIDTLVMDTIDLHLQRLDNIWIGNIDAPLLNLTMTQNKATLQLPNNEPLARMLQLPVFLSKEALFEAEWDSDNNHLKMKGDIPEFITSDGTVTALFSAEGETNEGSPLPKQLRAKVALDYITPKHILGSAAIFDIQPTPLYVEIDQAEITIDGHPFGTEGAILSQADNGTLTISGFSLTNGEQELSIDGYYGKNNDIKAKIHTNDLQIDFMLDMLGKGYLDFGGFASGDILLNADSLVHMDIDNLKVRDFSYIEEVLGNANLMAYYDFEKRDLFINAEIDNNGRISKVDCDIAIGQADEKAYVDLNFDVDSLPLGFVNYWTGGFLQQMQGNGTGQIRLYGSSDKLNLIGHPLLDISFTHDVLGARFFINDSIHFETDGSPEEGRIRLSNAKLNDRLGRTATVSGLVKHRYLENYRYDIDINLPDNSNGFLIFDYPKQRMGDLYWGQLYAKGQANLQGSTQQSQHRIGVQMEPVGKSVLYLSPGEQNFSENSYSFLTFHDKAAKEQEMSDQEMLSHVHTNNTESTQETMIEADLQIHASEHCLVNMQMDPLAEDRLICRGEGDINLRYVTNHDLSIIGNYNISQGSYTITMKGDLMSKSFQLKKGSQVSFTGVPSEADLNLNAVYSIPSANLKDLDESIVTAASLSRTTLPVDCKLFVNGSISSPQISFDLEVKNVADDVQAFVHNVIGTQEMLNREVFYLLLFGRFYTPEYASTSTSNNNNGLSSFASATLTSQLNNLLGHMSDNFSVGTNFHSDKGDFSDMEMDVSLQTRLFSDRLLLSGNVGYRDPANRVGAGMTNSTSFIGDFDVEYLINPSGSLRIKAYSHSNERYYNINNSLTTQGIGLVVRKDFFTLKDLLPWQPKNTK